MFKSMSAAGALLAAAASVSHVDFTADGVAVGGKPVTQEALQLREANGSTVLASRNKVEALSGVIEVSLAGDRKIMLEPGVRLGRAGEAWEVSTHGMRRVELTTTGGSMIVASPVRLTAADGGWRTHDGGVLEGVDISAGLAADLGVRRVAESFDVPPDGDHDDMLLTPRQRREKLKEKLARKLETRRLFMDDLMPAAEAVDEKALKRVKEVSPAG
ncbi:MAG: hypothetical protein AAB074_17455 [Planctomycetota bacterium]